MLSKREGKAKVLQANGVRSSFPYDIAYDFNLQASMRPSVQKPVCHTILSFSTHDSERLTDATMAKIANEYLHKMGYGDTQSLIVRHSDRQHPHLHICINRIGNNGKTISDHNEKYRSTKICRTRFKTKGNTDVVQGIIFEKDGCSFSGSKIDRSCSFSCLNAEIEQNSHK